MNDAEVISKAHDMLRANIGHDNDQLAVFLVRDLRATREAGLGRQAWLYDRDGCTHGEAVAMVEQLAGAVEGGSGE